MEEIDGWTPDQWAEDRNAVLVIETEVENPDGGTETKTQRHIKHYERVGGEMVAAWPPIRDGAAVRIEER